MMEILTTLWNWNWGITLALCFAVVAIPLVLLFKAIFKDPPQFPLARFPVDQVSIDNAFTKVGLHAAEEWGKGIGKAIFSLKLLDPNVLTLLGLVLAVLFVINGVKNNFFPGEEKPPVAQAGQTCTGIRNGQTVLLPEGTDLIVGQDICDGAIVVAQTQVPTQQALATDPTPISTQVVPTVDTMPSAVPTYIPATPVPLTAETKVYIVMKFTISPEGYVTLVDGRFNEGSLEGYQKVGDTQSCTLSNMPTFSVPAGYSEGLIYFEGIDKYQRPSGATVVGSTISFSLCTPTGTNFSLYMK